MKYGKTLFFGAAKAYASYRPRYPAELFDKIVTTFKPDKDDVLLDLDCGTGEIAFPLSKHFSKVIAWDPDADMLALAKQNNNPKKPASSLGR